ncbi:MAG: hypothetical protein U0169_19275 [Polyangiaceae bacterium]
MCEGTESAWRRSKRASRGTRRGPGALRWFRILGILAAAFSILSPSPASAAAVVPERIPIFFPQSWNLPQHAGFNERFIQEVLGGDMTHVTNIRGRLAVMVPVDRTFVRIVGVGEPTGLRPSWFAAQQFYGQSNAPWPRWVADDPSKARFPKDMKAAYFAGQGNNAHTGFGIQQAFARGVTPQAVERTAFELMRMGGVLEIDQETLHAYGHRSTPGEFSVVALDRNQAYDVSREWPDDPTGELTPRGKPYVPRHLRGWYGVFYKAKKRAQNVAAYAYGGAMRAGRVASSMARGAYAAARYAACEEIGSGLFSKAASNAANWSLRARFAFGAARMATGLVGGLALGYAVEKGVTSLTGSKDLGFAVGYAAGAYGGYATEAVLFGRTVGSLALRCSLYLLPIAVHMHVMSVHINAPLEEAMRQGDKEAEELYKEFNWGLGLGALWYGVKNGPRFYYDTVTGWFR